MPRWFFIIGLSLNLLALFTRIGGILFILAVTYMSIEAKKYNLEDLLK